MTEKFYREFEERYYAPRTVIKGLRAQYLPFVQPLARAYPGEQTFDIGCGRGEWLELMQEQGLAPFGVDLDAGMLEGCRDHGLRAAQGDAVAWLATLPDESEVVISAFHVVEHISFEQLQDVIRQALRVLRPGGLLIMETPNPENIAVATRNFYLDPTHVRPIPDLLLSFLTEFNGFARVKTLRLQENKGLTDGRTLSVLDVLSGVSPDYAVVAQKAGPEPLMLASAPAFSGDYGLSLADIAHRYDRQQHELAEQVRQLSGLARQIQEFQKETLAAQAQTQQLIERLDAVYLSSSWRVTAPMRWVSGQLILLRRDGLGQRLKAFASKFVRKVDFELNKRPGLRKRILAVARALGLHRLVVRLLAKARPQPVYVDHGLGVTANTLGPRARMIAGALKSEIKHEKGGD